MRYILRLICWMTLFVDVVLILASVFHGVFGNGYPIAEVRVGEFAVTSAMPGGAAFIVFVSVWTGVLACAVLYMMNRKPAGAA